MFRAILSACCALIATVGVHAANVLQNGDFSDGLAHWSKFSNALHDFAVGGGELRVLVIEGR